MWHFRGVKPPSAEAILNFQGAQPYSLARGSLEFNGYGYATRPIAPADLEPLSDVEAEQWLALERELEALKQGRFEAARRVLRLSRVTRSAQLKNMALEILSHAGGASLFDEIKAELAELLGAPLAQNLGASLPILRYCEALSKWGRLDGVPLILEHYMELKRKDRLEAALLLHMMGKLLAPPHLGSKAEAGPMLHEPLEEFARAVMTEYERLATRLGSDRAMVFRGELQSVRAYAQGMRAAVETRHPLGELTRLREKLEPATGIDCTSIFVGPTIRLSIYGPTISADDAIRITEGFLSSPEVERYQPGTRYFFGHRIPD